MKMAWCCKSFEWRFQSAGERGFAVFAAFEDSDGPIFVLQHRSLDTDAIAPNVPVKISLITDSVIEFCPWCGAHLKRYYKKRARELDRSKLRVSW